MLIFTRYAKAWAALVIGLITVTAHASPFSDAAIDHVFISIGGTMIAVAAAYLVPNKIDGFNVDEIAQALLDAGDEIALQTHGDDYDKDG